MIHSIIINMIKKIILFLLCILVTSPVYADVTNDQWTIYPIINSRYDKIIDSGDKVYFLSSGSLFSVDRSTNETYFYNSYNKLSGSYISNIYYNKDKKYLLVVYKDSNMDMIYDDGRSYCLPEIKDAALTDDKTINDVAFGSDRIVVATNFGIVLFDDNRREVVESGIYHSPIERVAVCADNIVVYSPYALKTSKINDRHNTFDSFRQVSGMYADEVIDISDNKIAWVNGSNKTLYITTIDFNILNISHNQTDIKVDSDLFRWEKGFYFISGDKVLIYDEEGNEIDGFDIPFDSSNVALAFYKNKSSVWLGSDKGYANYDMSSPTPTVLADWYKPESSTCKDVIYFYTSNDGKRIYAGNLGPSDNKKYLDHSAADHDGINIQQTTDLIENGKITDVSILEASANSVNTQRAQTANNNKRMYGGVTRMAEDPEDPDTYFIGNGLEGLYVVKNRKEMYKFNVDNTPFRSYWETRVFDVNFDPQGNLWVGHAHDDSDVPPYIMLPAKKLKKGYDKITENDWVWPNLSDLYPKTKDFISMFCRRSQYAFFINGAYEGFYILNTKGTYDNPKDDVCYSFYTLTDQDGNTFNPELYYSVVEDKNGRVWLGTSQGIFYMIPSSGIDENSIAIRPKVPRNDGTNYADFLLDSDQINSIAVDHSNRKWIATDISGVFLVSENGDKILRHFDSSNSPLPSNRVTAVVCDNNDNTVYFGTTEGLFSYKSDSSPAFDDFNEVYAYPNPVRPDYSGPVSIVGLMDNSLVKIADAAGNVFYQGRSEGGMVTWNACNYSGERVKSGIYYVYVSSGVDGQQSSGAVTKIMVIN